jgi:hypothetical protein
MKKTLRQLVRSEVRSLLEHRYDGNPEVRQCIDDLAGLTGIEEGNDFDDFEAHVMALLDRYGGYKPTHSGTPPWRARTQAH